MMIRRLTTLAVLLALGASLGACSKCGWIWDDWKSPGQTCKDDRPR
jgi:hypothetical protein